MLREGETEDLYVKTLATLIHGGCGAVLKVSVKNKTDKKMENSSLFIMARRTVRK